MPTTAATSPTRWSRDGWARLAASPPSVAAVVLLLYGIWLGILLPHSHGARDFINIGRLYILRGHGSTLIHPDPYTDSLANPGGFDGQFAYYIALDPLHATTYLDQPSYRLARILYPLLARALALGQPAAIPYTLLAVNWLALGGGTLALAAWLRRHNISAWFALIYGLYPGFLESLRYDLTEPLCYGLVALAIYLIDAAGPRRVLWAGLAFALAALARESALFFAIPYGLAQLLARPAPAPAQLLARLTLALAAHWPRSGSSPDAAQPRRHPAADQTTAPTYPEPHPSHPTDSAAPPNGNGTLSAPLDPSGSRLFHDPLGSGLGEIAGPSGSGLGGSQALQGQAWARLQALQGQAWAKSQALQGQAWARFLANLPSAAALLALASLPLLAWRVFLYLRLGNLGTPAWAFQSQPFAGFRAYYPWAPAQIEEVRSVVLPAAICALVALWALWRRCWAAEILDPAAQHLALRGPAGTRLRQRLPQLRPHLRRCRPRRPHLHPAPRPPHAPQPLVAVVQRRPLALPGPLLAPRPHRRLPPHRPPLTERGWREGCPTRSPP